MLGDWTTFFVALLLVPVLPLEESSAILAVVGAVVLATPQPTTVAGRAISSAIVVMGLGTLAALTASLAAAHPHAVASTPSRVRVIVPRAGRVLMVQHRDADGLFWILPGGGVKVGETLEQAAVREVWEEAGARCRVVPCAAWQPISDDAPIGPLTPRFWAPIAPLRKDVPREASV
ncbi:MAG TPA: NUDIX hydrolase [Candidatus Limnocylindria bacterium]|nr:NUDIX hydrolase [Candidatus Limnocylindria bacterium]